MNVLLIILDSVRAANTSLHGHENETTPFLEQFSDEATIYTQARSPGSWSLPSHTSIFTGLHVYEHGLTQAKDKLEPGNTVFEWLHEDQGYATGMFSENTWVTEMDVGLKEAFQTIEGARNVPFPDAFDPSNFVLTEGQGEYVRYLRRCLRSGKPLRSIVNGAVTKLAWDYPGLLPSKLKASTPARVYTDLFLDWVDDRGDDWAACINLMDGHMPYEPDERYDLWGGAELRRLQNAMDDQVWEFLGGQRPWWQRRALEGIYDGAIYQMDREIERIITGLKERGAFDDTLVVVTSDHGEGFGEVSRLKPGTRLSGHGKDVHEALLHVPLVVRLPGQTDHSTVSKVATLTRFPKVVREALGGGTPREGFVPAGPVVASTHGLDEPSRKLAEKYCGGVSPYDGLSRTAYEDCDGEVMKYESWGDQEATVRILDAKTSVTVDGEGANRVEAAFDEFEDAGVRIEGSGVGDLDDATQQRLKDLGYM